MITSVFAWTDTITSSTPIKAVHITELRSAIDAERNNVGLSSYSWTDTITTSTSIKAVHFSQMRTAIAQIYSKVGLSAPSWTGTISAGGVPSTLHLTEPRSRKDSVSATVASYKCCGGGACPTTDDSACGTISCDDWHVISGSASPTGTNYCYDTPDITSNRCEGINDCKDANTADCGSSLDTLELSCGICKYVNGCTGITDGYCSNYGAGTDTGTCRECDGAGSEQVPADDGACGTISCDDWHHIVGSASATGTNYCYDSPDITSNRCEGLGDCKDANTADCGSSDDTLELSCGTCKYVAGCSGTTDGYCFNYASGYDTGLCRECDGAGSERADTDDVGCGTIDCDGLDNYFQTGTESATTTEYCYFQNYNDITSNRCEGINDCKDPNSGDCTYYTTPLQYTCGTCKYISGSSCTGGTLGSCSNYGAGTSCGTGYECDGSGNCVAATRPQTLWMSLKNGYLLKRDSNENFYTSLGDKGYDIQQMVYANNKLWLAQYDGTNFILSSCTLDGSCTSHGVMYALRPDSMAYYNGYIYVGTTGDGSIIRCTTTSSPSCTKIGSVGTDAYSMAVFGGYLWIGEYYGELNAYDGSTFNKPQDFSSGSDRIFTMTEFDHSLWVALENGYLYRCISPFRSGDHTDTSCTSYGQQITSGVPYSMSGYNDKLWIGTSTGSLYSCVGGSCTEQRTFDYYIPDLESFNGFLQVLQYTTSADGAWECADAEVPCNSKGSYFSQPARLTTTPPEGDIIYIAHQLKQGNLGGRSGADAYCVDKRPTKLECDNIHAFLSVSDTDEIRDMPSNYGYDSNDPIYWFDINENAYTKLANNWADMLDESILVSQATGTGESIDRAWSGSSSDGSIYYYIGNYYTCNGWVTTSGDAAAGESDETNYKWLSVSHQNDCDGYKYVRCICEGATS